LQIKPSHSLAFLVAAFHSIVILAAMASCEGLTLALVLVGTLFSVFWWVAESLLLLPGSVVALEISADGSATWRNKNGKTGASHGWCVEWCSRSLVVLGLRQTKSRWHRLFLLPDSADPDSLRTLRILARLRPS